MWQRRMAEGGRCERCARSVGLGVREDKRFEAFWAFQKNVLEGPKRVDVMVSKRFGSVQNVSETKEFKFVSP